MSYCSESDVLEATGLTVARISEIATLSNAEVSAMITNFITQSDEEIKKLLSIPVRVEGEKHEVDEDIANYTTRVYLGNHDESYVTNPEKMDTFDVQGLVQAVLLVYVNGSRVKTTDDEYAWAWTHGAAEDYILFSGTQELSDGDEVIVYYTYDPYAITTPANIETASACLAGIKLLDHMAGVRQRDTEFDAQSESGVPDTTKDALTVTRKRLHDRYLEAMASEGYGFNFVPVRG